MPPADTALGADAAGDAGNAAVTVVITRRVKEGREAEYEAWLARFQAEARGLAGYLGVTTQRPAPGGPREYISVIRFATLADLRAFETSDLRARRWPMRAPLRGTGRRPSGRFRRRWG